MPRVARFVEGWVSQTVRPDYGRSTILLITQVYASSASAPGLVSVGLRYEGLVATLVGVLGAGYHSCDERLWCAGLGLHTWRFVNDFMFYTLLATFAAVASGLSPRLQGVLRGALAGIDAFALTFVESDVQVHAFLVTLPFVLLAATWTVTGSRRGVHSEVLVGAAGILTPALLLYILSSSEGDNDTVVIDNSNELRLPPGYRLASMPPTNHFWLFHSVWHVASTGAAHLALTCRIARPKGESPSATSQQPARIRRAGTRHWLAVLLSRYMPSNQKRKQTAATTVASGTSKKDE